MTKIQILENENNYSTEEHVIGKWINGKPIYQKSITDFGSMPNANAEKNYDVSDWNIEEIVNIEGILCSSDNTREMNGEYYGAWYTKSTKKLCIKAYSDARNYTSTVFTIQYTKTTD